MGRNFDPAPGPAADGSWFFLLYLLGVKRPIGRFFLSFFRGENHLSWGATVLAAVVISFPLMYRSARGAFEQVNGDLIDAGRTLECLSGRFSGKSCFPMHCPEFYQRDPGVCKRAGRIWRHGNDRGKYCGQDKDPAAGCIFGCGSRQHGGSVSVCACACGDFLLVVTGMNYVTYIFQKFNRR